MNEKSEKKQFFIKFLVIALCFIMVSSVIGVTVAWYVDYRTEQATINLGKVELGDTTVYSTTLNLGDVIAGTEILSAPLKVSKMSDSVPVYIRAKLSFSIVPGQGTPPPVILLNYLQLLKTDTEFSFYRIAQGESGNKASWSYKYGNYIYLVHSVKDGAGVNGANDKGERMFVVDNEFEYVLTKSIKMPMSLYQDGRMSQYMKKINFNFSFEAIQAVELSSYSFDDIVSIFNQSFPENFNESNSYNETLLDAGIVSHYMLNGSLTDSKGNSAMTGGTATYQDGAYSINGQKQELNITQYANKKKFSLSFYAKFPAESYTAEADLFNFEARDKYYETNEESYNICLKIMETTGETLDLRGGIIASEGVVPLTVSRTQFDHFVIVADGLKFKFYKNGELAGFMTYLYEDWTLTGKLTFGDAGMQGYIKDLRIFDGVVSEYQVTEIYNGN